MNILYTYSPIYYICVCVGGERERESCTSEDLVMNQFS